MMQLLAGLDPANTKYSFLNAPSGVYVHKQAFTSDKHLDALYKKRRVKDSFTRKLDGRVNKYYKIPPDVLFLFNPPVCF